MIPEWTCRVHLIRMKSIETAKSPPPTILPSESLGCLDQADWSPYTTSPYPNSRLQPVFMEKKIKLNHS